MTRPPRITVFGTGYLGTAHAACLASLGFEVLGVDIDAARPRRGRVAGLRVGLPRTGTPGHRAACSGQRWPGRRCPRYHG
jgi:nucleoside-diphosphate-sugar epimerase